MKAASRNGRCRAVALRLRVDRRVEVPVHDKILRQAFQKIFCKPDRRFEECLVLRVVVGQGEAVNALCLSARPRGAVEIALMRAAARRQFSSLVLDYSYIADVRKGMSSP